MTVVYSDCDSGGILLVSGTGKPLMVVMEREGVVVSAGVASEEEDEEDGVDEEALNQLGSKEVEDGDEEMPETSDEEVLEVEVVLSATVMVVCIVVSTVTVLELEVPVTETFVVE